MVDTRVESSAEAMIKDLKAGEIDIGVLWGPMAGFFARQANPPIQVVPLLKETGGPRLVYRIAMGVRASDQNWKRELNRLIEENQPEINKLLLELRRSVAGRARPPDHRRFLVARSHDGNHACRFVMFAFAMLVLAPASVLGRGHSRTRGISDRELSCSDACHPQRRACASRPPRPSDLEEMAAPFSSMCCRTRRAQPTCHPERSGEKSRG